MLRSLKTPVLRCLPRPSSIPRHPLGRRLIALDAFSRDPAELDNLTRLPNGVRVATEALPGHFSALGVFVETGSRYENERLRGVSHITDRLAFKSTSEMPAEAVLAKLESLGGNVQCASSRESIMYQAAVFNQDVESMLGIIAGTVRNPLITEREVSEQLDTAAYEITEIWAKPELILPELLHTAAYQDNTLGNPLLCPREQLPHIDASVVREYRDIFYRPDRLVVAFAGVEHDRAVKLTERYFGDMKPATPSLPTSTSAKSSLLNKLRPSSSSRVPLDLTSPAHYTGGYLHTPPSDVPTHLPRFTHLYIGFEGLPITDPDIYALATLQTLLGGGGSFSAGGPGKGMYSRLYTNVLNQHGWVESCVAFNHSYADSGLFGIAASCVPQASHALADVVIRELTLLFRRTASASSFLNGIRPAEVIRAKNQLRSSLLMNLESRMIELEDLGRQVQVHGRKIPVTEMSERIESLTVKDLQRVAERVLTGNVNNAGKGTGKPTIIVQATEEELSTMGDLTAAVKRHRLGK